MSTLFIVYRAPTSRKFYISSQMRFFLNSVARSLRSQVCLLSVARSFRSQIFNTGPIHEQGRRQDFSLGGGAVGERSEPTRPIHLRSEQAVAGVWGRSLQRGPGAGSRGGAPWRGLGNFLRIFLRIFLRNRVF